ncbi:MAG: glycosyltransferase [Anaerolineae bacterium]|nr:glycosyltransferase [Anaerolineae bacterium]
MFVGTTRTGIGVEIGVDEESLIWPKVCVLILNWNGLSDTLDALASLSALSYPNYEIVVVDNGSEGDDADALKRRVGNRIHLVQNEKNYGFAEGNNIAMRYTLAKLEPDYIALLNNDAVVSHNWLTELIKPFLADDSAQIAVTSPTIVDYSCPERIRFGNDSRVSIFGQVRHSQRHSATGELRTITGASFVIKASVVQGLEEFFCPEYFAYYEDVDLSWRLINLGYRLVHVPTAVVSHKESASLTTENLRARMDVAKTRNKYLTFYRNLSSAKYAIILPLLVSYDIAVTIGVALFRRDLGFARCKMRGIVESFRSLRRVQHIGGGGFSYLDKRLYLDKLG